MPAFGRIRTRALTRGAHALAATPRTARPPAARRRARSARASAATTSSGIGGAGGVLSQPVPGGPVADVLLVERRLRAARLVLVGGPEARGVRRADLVAEHQRAVGVEPELELRVGEDHAALARVVGDRAVDGQRDVAHALGQRAVADQLDGRLEVDRLVVALVGLRRRRVDRLREPIGLAQALRQLAAPTRCRCAGSPSSPSRRGSRARRTPPAASPAAARAARGRAGRPARRRWRRRSGSGRSAPVRSNQSTDRPVSTRPLSGIGVGCTTS